MQRYCEVIMWRLCCFYLPLTTFPICFAVGGGIMPLHVVCLQSRFRQRINPKCAFLANTISCDLDCFERNIWLKSLKQ